MRTQPTGRRHHPLPFLEEAGLEAVSGAEAVGLVSGHELLHGLQDHTELQGQTAFLQNAPSTQTFQSFRASSGFVIVHEVLELSE